MLALNIDSGTGTLLPVELEDNMTVDLIKSGNDKFLLECTLTDDSSALNIECIEFLDSSEALNNEVKSARQGNSIPDNPQDASIYQESSSENIFSGNSSKGQAVIVPLESSSDNVAHEDSFEPEVTSTPHKKHKRQYTPPEKLTRKRLSKPQKWKRNVNKEKIARGEEYKNTLLQKVKSRKPILCSLPVPVTLIVVFSLARLESVNMKENGCLNIIGINWQPKSQNECTYKD